MQLAVGRTIRPILRSYLVPHQAAYLSRQSYLSVESCMAVASEPGTRLGRDWQLTGLVLAKARSSCMEGSCESGCDNTTPDRRRIGKVLVTILPLTLVIDCTRVKRARDSIYQQLETENRPREPPRCRIERVTWQPSPGYYPRSSKGVGYIVPLYH